MTQMTLQQALETALEHHRNGRLAEAESLYRAILQQIPNHADTLSLLGVLAAQTKHYDSAVDLLGRAIAANPNQPDYCANLGNAFTEMGQLDKAVATCRRAIEIQPNHTQGWFNLGVALEKQGKTQEAIAAWRTAISTSPNYAEAYGNIGSILHKIGDFDESLAASRKAIEINPGYAEGYVNLALALEKLGDLTGAMAAHRKAIQLQPNLMGAHWNLGLLLLRSGQFDQGWKEYDWRQRESSPFQMNRFPHPHWCGEDLGGKTILIHSEQGFGDTMQFVRYIPQVAQRGGRINLQCQTYLVPLLTHNYGKYARVTDALTDHFDLHCPLLSLPAIFKTDLSNIPANVPYLTPPPEKIETWRKRFDPGDQRLRVGLAWAGRPDHSNDAFRSIPLSSFLPLAIPGVALHSLQKGDRASEALSPPAGMSIVDHSHELNDFSDTAALIHHLDLVIAVDTAVVHLAGAMAKPTWVLLVSCPDWRWLIDRPDSPWYSTMRLFRQNKWNDWAPTLNELSTAFRQWAATTTRKSG